MADQPILQYPQDLGGTTDPVSRAMRMVVDNLLYLRNTSALNPNQKQEVINQISQTVQPIQNTVQTLIDQSGLAFADTHAVRVFSTNPADLPVGTPFFETDRTALYVVVSITGLKKWVYVAGMMQGTFAARPADLLSTDVGFPFFANGDTPSYNHVFRWSGTAWTVQYGLMRGTLSPNQKPAGLTAADVDFRFHNPDFDHTYRWNGTVWHYDDEDEGSGFFREYGHTPTKGVWQLCDGSIGVQQSFDDGTVGNTNLDGLAAGTMVDYTTAAYVKSGTSNTLGPTAASGQTSDESLHTHALPLNTGNESSDATVEGNAVVTPTQVANAPHTHGIGGVTGAGSAHHHTPNTIELRNTVRKTFYRL